MQACGFRDDYDKYLKSNIVVFGISYDSPRALKKFKEKWKPFQFVVRFKERCSCKIWSKYASLDKKNNFRYQ